MIVVAYGLILPKSVLNMPRFGCINVHCSLLPRWRGAAPIQYSILSGDKKTGVSIIQMNTGIDTGDILYEISCYISNKDTSATLCNKLMKLGIKGLIKTLKLLVNNKIRPKIQDQLLATYAKKINKNEARIDWSLSAIKLERCVRAFNPWPISWTKIDGKVIKIWKASVIKNKIIDKPGTIIKSNKYGIKIATAEGILNLEVIQLSGKKPISVLDFLNSHSNLFVPGKIIF